MNAVRAQNIEQLAQAMWTRCRSLQERKEGATWDSITDKHRQAWIDGLTADLESAKLYLSPFICLCEMVMDGKKFVEEYQCPRHGIPGQRWGLDEPSEADSE